ARKQRRERHGQHDQSLRGRAHRPGLYGDGSVTGSSAMSNGASRPVTSAQMSTAYCSVSRPSPMGIDEYGIHSRARHIVSDTHRLSSASFQKRNVVTVITAQNAADMRLAPSASQ